MNCDPGTDLFRRAAGFGAWITAAVAVSADVIAGEHPLHTATLGLVTLVVAVMRHRLAGRHEGLFAAARGAIVAQPVLHAAMMLLPDPSGPGFTGFDHTAAETSMTAVHVLVAAVIVAGVAGVERLYLAVATLYPFTRWLFLLTSAAARPERPAPVAAPLAAPATRRAHVDDVRRRGPPVATRAAAV